MTRTIHYDNSTLAFSPSAILNGFVSLHHKGACLPSGTPTSISSRQYLDNTENDDRALPCYSTSNVQLSYTALSKRKPGCAFPTLQLFRRVVFGLNFNNIFSRRYAANGWVYSAICDSYGHPNDNRYYQIGFIPMAGFTMMGNVTLRF